jgi:DmsE family decaheme c-type cytochrome
MANGQTTMNITKPLFAALLLSSGLAFSAAVVAQGAAPAAQRSAPAAEAPAPTAAEPPAPAPGLGTEYSEKGADTCLMCHTEAWPYPVFPIFKTKHANRADARTPFAFGGRQCEACHGPGAKHAAGGDKNAINNFKPTSFLSPGERNKFCLECHRGNARTGWIASTHESNNVACTNCHKLHAERDPVLATATQPEVCYNCHKQQRADFNNPSAHPVRFGRMTCSECHSPHGSNTAAMLAKPTVNQTCYTCHTEKRGPFLWEHAPVAEDCTLCHSPHGTVRPSLLTKTPPLLCQQCHTVAGHPSVAYTGAALPGGGAGGSAFLLAGSCTNCHSQIHGSNHPSGFKLMR